MNKGLKELGKINAVLIIVGKRLKALEIIKEKRVHTRAIQDLLNDEYNNVEFYNKQYARSEDEDLTEEEFDLLKEYFYEKN